MTLLFWTILVAVLGIILIAVLGIVRIYKIIPVVLIITFSLVTGCINSVSKCTNSYIVTTVNSNDKDALKNSIWTSTRFEGSEQSKKAKKREDDSTISKGLSGFYTVQEEEQNTDHIEIVFNKVSFIEYLNFIATANPSIIAGTHRE